MQRPWEDQRGWKKARVLESRVWNGEWQEVRLGRRYELDQILVFILRTMGNL